MYARIVKSYSVWPWAFCRLVGLGRGAEQQGEKLVPGLHMLVHTQQDLKHNSQKTNRNDAQVERLYGHCFNGFL